jgi:hypothetical protein
MKNSALLSFVSIVLFVMMISCGSDDDKSSPSLTGKWQVSTLESYNCVTTTDNKTYTCGTYAWCVVIEFKSNNTFAMTRSSDGSNMGSGTFTFSGNTLALSYVDNPYNTQSPYHVAASVSGNTMTLNYESTTGCDTKTVYQKL